MPTARHPAEVTTVTTTSVRSVGGNIEEHFPDRARLDRVVGGGGLLEPIVVQGYATSGPTRSAPAATAAAASLAAAWICAGSML